MNKHIIFTTLLAALVLSQSAFAAQTPSYYLSGAAEETKCVKTNGGVINTTINCQTGVLEGSLTPGFLITTSSGGNKFLSMDITANTQTGFTNAVYNDGTLAYVILTNTDSLPQLSSVNNIKTLAPTPSLNPDAIAYHIIDPPNQTGVLETEFQPATNNWKLHLSKKGPVATLITIPAGSPYPNTFSGDDGAGRYQATVTLSFV
jgi:hypothetical protein